MRYHGASLHRQGFGVAMEDGRNRVVLGARLYRVDTPWGDLAGRPQLGLISQVAADSEGSVVVLQRAPPLLIVFDREGRFVRSFGDDLVRDGHGIHIDRDDRVFVVDRDAHQVLIFAVDGTLLGRLGERDTPRFGAPFNHPTGCAVAEDGEIYVSDGYGNTLVHRFSSEGRLLQSWGERGSGPGAFSTPHAIWIDRADRVLVADRENDRVQIFDRDGRFLGAWNDIYHPMDIFENEAGQIFVTDQVPRLNMFSPDGRLEGCGRPALNSAHGVSGDAAGNIYLAEMIPSRVTRLTPTA